MPLLISSALLGTLLVAGLLYLAGTLPPDLRENSNDLRLYREAGEALLAGEVPYRDFFLEYPPASLPAFAAPALLTESRNAYISLFSAEMALVLAATLFLVALTARRLRGPRAWPLPVLAFAAAALALYPVAVTRFDAVVALTLALGCAGAAFGRPYLAYATLGFGAAAKLVPALATPALATPALATPGPARRGVAVRGYAVFLAVVALFFVPAALLGGGGFLGSFAYHAHRGLQIESVPASLLMMVGGVDGVVFRFGAFEARGPGAALAAGTSLPVTAGLLLVTGFAMLRARRRGLGAEAFPRYAAALILAFMLGSKVLSPQYMLWLLPLVPLGAGGAAGLALCLVLLAACGLTTQVFPHHYADLLGLRPPGPGILIARNTLLAVLWGMLLLIPGRRGSGGAPA